MAGRNVTFRLDGVQDALNRIRRAGNEVRAEVDMELADGANLIRTTAVKNVKQNIDNTTGKLAVSMFAQKIGPLQHEVGNNVFYAPYIEFGTGGKVSVPQELKAIAEEVRSRPKRGNFADMHVAIYEWAVRKGYISKNDKTGMAKAKWWAIRILKNGISPQPFLYPAFVANRQKIVDRIKRVLEEPR